MYVIELTYPGTWLDYPDRDEWCWRIQNQILPLESTVIDAALALSLFDSERAKPRRRHDRDAWAQDSQRRQEIEAAVRARLGIDPHSMDRWDEIRDLTEVEFKREQWAAGRLPDSYQHRVIFLHARSFLYAMDRLERCMDTLAKEDGVPAAVRDSHTALCAALPQLRGVRDSVSHFDERSRGEARGQPLELKPVINEMVHAPGGALILESLMNNRFGSTMADGHYGEVEVSLDTMMTAARCVQQVINGFTWKGFPRRVPY